MISLAAQLIASGEARSLDVRIIVATHVDLGTAARRGTFRADLLGRFARSTLTLVPLRERPEDILPLARHFAGQLAQRHGEALRLTTDAEEQLRCYPWPGNVRELSDVIERAARRHGRDEIGAEELGLPRA
jgi:DNA-binding NtrC family response regulator